MSFLVGRFFTLTGRPSRNTCNVDVARQLVAKISKSNKDNSISHNFHISHFPSQTSIFYFWLFTSAFESYHCILLFFIIGGDDTLFVSDCFKVSDWLWWTRTLLRRAREPLDRPILLRPGETRNALSVFISLSAFSWFNVSCDYVN